MLRATRQEIEVLAAGSGKLRATQQFVEVLATGSSILRVTQQCVEVLVAVISWEVAGVDTLIIEESATREAVFGCGVTDTLSLIDTAIFDLIKSAVDTLALTEQSAVDRVSLPVQLHQNRFYYHLVECNQRVGSRILGPHPDCDASVLANLNIYGDTSFVRQVHARLVGDVSNFYSVDCSSVQGLIFSFGGWIGGIIGNVNQLTGFIQLDPDTEEGVLWGTVDYRLRGSVDNIRGDLSDIYGDIYCHGVVTYLTGNISGLKNLDVSFLSGNATGIRCYQYPASVSGNIDGAMAASGYTDADRDQGIDLQNLTQLGWV